MEAASAHTEIQHTVLYSLITAMMETSLNHMLFKEKVLQPARMRLAGKVMSIELKELNKTLTLIFAENHVDVLSEWTEAADCTIKTSLFTLVKLKDKQQLSQLINHGDIVIEGDMQIVQHWSSLLDLAIWNPAHYLSPYIGDVAAEGLSKLLNKGVCLVTHLVKRQKTYVKDALIEEWKMAPSQLELVHFSDEVEQIESSMSTLEQRLSQLEEKNDTR
ncbi:MULTISPECIES: ubiquinone biosynthesis accessory factor UbiJ [Providencia]|uniref:ubiquinone biosynthesis accessory factor UbiJ n=1 Tax=Providencia TaxID=586 RepID=UPI00198199DF|nr:MULTISPECIES: SCP2 domain-containing protein [Providencia]HEC8329151.1 SCP2 domain-containing protein [Providencia rettgeri]MBN4866822.1 SCP2 domain-containing protein [Providencia stuartii]MBN4876274.1 SCP2 domain-containing protein [Providencia stuartii]MBN4880836.1 SCP2 domain-containing protein [Providencia stuartii]MBN4885344.1 SCP2 domain-containing protein [Providencia stuartii]